MSAFMCSARHLTALAAYAVRADLDGIVGSTREERVAARVAEVFGVLARENAASLDARYPGDKGDPIEDVDAKAASEQFPLLHIIKACHCYAYQACEHKGWETSRAKSLVEVIEAHAVRALPGYAAAPLGIVSRA